MYSQYRVPGTNQMGYVCNQHVSPYRNVGWQSGVAGKDGCGDVSDGGLAIRSS